MSNSRKKTIIAYSIVLVFMAMLFCGAYETGATVPELESSVSENGIAREGDVSDSQEMNAINDPMDDVSDSVQMENNADPQVTEGTALGNEDETATPEEPNEGKSLAGEEEMQGLEADDAKADEPILVNVPATVHMILDPYNLKGKGQIYSKPAYFINEGTEPLSIKITGIHFSVNDNLQDDIELYMHIGDDIIRINAGDNAPDTQVLLEPGEANRVGVSFFGSIASGTEFNWLKANLALSFAYDITR